MTVVVLIAAVSCTSDKEPVYKDATADIEDRVEDLIGRMTVEEKILQLNQYSLGLNTIEQNIGEQVGKIPEEIGSLIYFDDDAVARNAMQKRAMEESRLGILPGSRQGISGRRHNPSGKLAMTFPYTAGQIPIYYNRRPKARNSGKHQGFYDDLTNDPYSHITRPVKELKFFEKKLIKAGESETFRFEIDPKRDLGFVNSKGEKYLDKGEYRIMVGDQTVSIKVI